MEKQSPYVGPRAYKDGEHLYGRNTESRDLFRLLMAERIVLFYSPSGAGKTSLLVAKLTKKLVSEGFQVLGPARVSGAPDQKAATASSNPYTASLIHYWEEKRPAEVPPIEDLAGIDLCGYLTQRSWIRNDPRPKILILDQFEEIITRNPLDSRAKQEFFEQLGLSLQNRDRWAIISMREEHIAGLDPYLDYLPTRLAARFRLDLLNHEGALKAISEPAESAGVTFDNNALKRLVKELNSVREPGGKVHHTLHVEPLHLQVVCDRLWKSLPDGLTKIGPSHVGTAGDVDEALENYYRGAVESVAKNNAAKDANCDEKLIREWFEEELISPAGLRDQLQKGKTHTGSLPNPVVELLENQYLLRSEIRRGNLTYYEIAHDRLVEAIRSDNRRWLKTQDEAVQLLKTGLKKHKEYRNAAQFELAETEFLTEERIHIIEVWAGCKANSLTSEQKNFLQASRNHWAKKRKRDLRKRFVFAAAVIAAFAFGLMYLREKNAETKARLHETKARIHRLVADAPTARWRDQDHELSVLLSLQAQRFADQIGGSADVQPRIMDDLRDTLQARPFNLSPKLVGKQSKYRDAEKVAFSPDARFVAIGSKTDRIDIVPIKRDIGKCSYPQLRTRSTLRSLAFSPSGRYLVAVTKSGVELFASENLPCPGEAPVSISGEIDSAVLTGPFCMTSNDFLIFAATTGGGVARWRLSDGKLHPEDFSYSGFENDSAITAMVCDPEGVWLALGNDNGAIIIRRPAMQDVSAPIYLSNNFEDWPKEAKMELERLRDYLSYGVSALVLWPEGKRLVVVFYHGPVGMVPLPDTPYQPRLSYIWTTRTSEAVLKAAINLGMSSMSHNRKPKILKATLIGSEGELGVGSEKFLGKWTLGALFADHDGKKPVIPQQQPPKHLYAHYHEIRTPGAGIEALGAIDGGKVVGEVDSALNARLWLRKGLQENGYSTWDVRHDEYDDNVIWTIGFMPGAGAIAAGGSRYLILPRTYPNNLEIMKTDGQPCFMGSYRRMCLSPDGKRMAAAVRNDPQPGRGGQTTKSRFNICPNTPDRSTDYILLMDFTTPGTGSPGESIPVKVNGSEGLWSVAWTKGKWTGGRELLASGDYNGQVWLWLLEGGKCPQTGCKQQSLPDPRRKPVRSVALHPTEPYLALGTNDGYLQIWRLAVDDSGRISAEMLMSPRLQAEGPIWALAWSPNGETLALGNSDGGVGIVRQSDMERGNWHISQLKTKHTMGVTDISFCRSDSPGACGQNMFASAGNDGKVRLWQIRPGEKVPVALTQYQTLEGPKAEVLSVAFSPDGKLVTAGDSKGKVHVWHIEKDYMLKKACTALQRNLSKLEWDEYIGENVAYECTCPELPPGQDTEISSCS